MAYVPGYQYDLFVSYAHVDNVPIESSAQGWVDALFRNFEVSLTMKLGRQNMASIWRDRQSLRGNQEVTGHIDEQVRKSALLLLVLSPAYLASQSCLKELETFAERNASDRIFVVWKDPSEKSQQPLPPQIRDLRKYKFWFEDENQKTRTLGWPAPRSDSVEDRKYYFPVVVDLVDDVCAALEGLKSAGESNSPAPNTPASTPPVANGGGQAQGTSVRAVPRKGAVLLAPVTGDLDPRREEVRRYLGLEGIDALPSGVYRLTRTEFEKAFIADLKLCKAFVQMLGPYASMAPPDVPEGFCRLQFDLARAHGVPILQWRNPELNLDDVAQAAQRALLGSEFVQAMPIEEFKRSIVELFAEPAPPPPPRPPSFLFVDAADTDVESAACLVADLDDSLEWTMPLYDPNDTAEVIQRAAEENLVKSDAVVFFYGNANPRWVLSQVDLYRKLKPQRESDPKLLALIQAPPVPKVPIPIKLRGMKVLSYEEAAVYIQGTLVE